MPEPPQPGEAPGDDPSPHAAPHADPHADPSPEADCPVAGDLGSGQGDPPPPGVPRQPAPDWADSDAPIPLRQLDSRWVTAERISGAIGALVLSTGALVAVLVFGAGWRVLGLGAWAILTAILFTGAIAGPALQYRRARYRVTAFGIEIRWGILWRRVTIVPRSRIQHTDVEQGPLLRRFELAKLVIHTAGTEHSTVPLYGLAMGDAASIRDDLMGRAGESGPRAAASSVAGANGAGDGI